jgi:hypothetical protein
MIREYRQFLTGFDRSGFLKKQLLHTSPFRPCIMRNFDYPGTRFNATQRTDSLLRIQSTLRLGQYAGARKQEYYDKEKYITGFGIHQSFLKKSKLNAIHPF